MDTHTMDGETGARTGGRSDADRFKTMGEPDAEINKASGVNPSSNGGRKDGRMWTFSFWRKWTEDEVYRSKVTRSLCIGFGLFCFAIVEAQSGPTFLDIQLVVNEDAETAALFFTSRSIGYLVGCVLAGLLSKRFRRSFLIFFNFLALSSVTIATPHCSTLASMIAMRTAVGVFGGIVDTHLNADHMKTWGNEGQVLMQLLHFMYSVGCLVSPLISEPFLADRANTTSPIEPIEPIAYDNSDHLDAFNTVPVDVGFNGTYLGIVEVTDYLNGSSTDPPTVTGFSDTQRVGSLRKKTNVHYAFLLSGIGTVIASIPFFIMFIKERRLSPAELNQKVRGSPDADKSVTYRKLPRFLHYIAILLLCSFFQFYCAIENTFSSLLMTFLVSKYEDVTKSQAARIMAIFWSCFASSRFLMIFLAKRFSPMQLLTSSIGLMGISLVTFNCVADLGHVVLVTLVAAFVGLSMAGIYASGFSWSESEYLRVTGSVSACILFSSVSGVVMNPLLVVYSMEEHGPLYYCYIFTVEVVILVSIFATLVLFNRKYLNIKYGPMRIVAQAYMDVCIDNNDRNIL